MYQFSVFSFSFLTLVMLTEVVMGMWCVSNKTNCRWLVGF